VLKNVDRPLLMTSSDVNEAIVRDIALRLTAIRETFEESGILLHKNTQTNGAYSFTDKELLSDWRGKVHKSPEEFLELYKLLETVPDIWSLTEWSDWLTPTDLHEQGRRRFDTIFYQTSLQTIPTTLLDQQEVTAVQWTDPASILQQFYNKELWLAPPQVYELSKLLRLTNLDNLDRVSTDRQHHGLSTWLPVRMECQDGLLSLLPGDFMYPSDPDYIGLDGSDPNSAHAKKTVQIKYDGTMEDSRGGQNVKLNRLELNMYESSYDCVPRVSYDSEHNHIKPMTFSDFQVKNEE